MGVVQEGGYGAGVNPIGYHYPFIREVSGAERLFADMYLGHSYREVVLPLRITDIANFTQPAYVGRADITVVDADGHVVFNSSDIENYRNAVWSDRFVIHEWLGTDSVCRVVQHTGQHNLEDVISYPSTQTLVDAILDERVSELWPDKLTSITINGQLLTGNVEFSGGYNFDTTLSDVNNTDGQGHINSVFVNAPAGGGLGPSPACDDVTGAGGGSGGVGDGLPIRRINQVPPSSDGSFIIQPTDCLWLTRKGTTKNAADSTNGKPGLSPATGKDCVVNRGPNTPTKVINFALENPAPGSGIEPKKGMEIKNNCTPCCTCDDFVNTYRGIEKLFNEYKKLGERSVGVRDTHQENIDRWKSQKDCRESKPVRVNTFPFRSGSDSMLKVAIGICNNSDKCKGEYEIALTFTPPPAFGGSGFSAKTADALKGNIKTDTSLYYDPSGNSPESYKLEGTWPNYSAKWTAVESQRLARLSFDMSFSRKPKIIWDGYFNILDGPGGKLVMTGRFIAGFNDVEIKDKYDILAAIYWPDSRSTMLTGYKTEQLADKSTASDILETDMLEGVYKSLGNWNWTLVPDPYVGAAKLNALRLKYDKTSTWYVGTGTKRRSIYTGRLYVDTVISPTYVPRVNSGDYVKLSVVAKINGEVIPNGTVDQTIGLKVS